MDNTFLGLNGFVWWIGVVENNNDPLKIGRCQVRIFGWHTDDKNLIPTADLPWSHAVLPINSSKSFSVPSMGDWVNGYFFDGKSGQFPAYFGVLPGVISQNVNKNQSHGFTDPSTSGAVTTTPKVNTDGSGTTFTNNPYTTTPQLPGQPSTNLAAVNSKTNPPPSVTEKTKDQTVNVSNVDAQTVGTNMLSSATGAASAAPKPTGTDGVAKDANTCGLDPNSAMGEIAGFFNSASDLLTDTQAYVMGLEQKAQDAISGAISKATNNITSAISSAVNKVDAAVTSASNSFNDMLSKASAEVNSQIANAELAATKALNDAEAAASKTLDDLTAASGDVGCTILSGLAGMAPAKVTVIQPIIVNPTTKKAEVSIGTTTLPSTVKVPNEIPETTHIAHAPSNQAKSLENTVTIWKDLVIKTTTNIENAVNGINASWSSNLFSSGGTVDQTSANGYSRFYKIWNDLADQENTIASNYNNTSIVDELETFRAPYKARVIAAVSSLPEGY